MLMGVPCPAPPLPRTARGTPNHYDENKGVGYRLCLFTDLDDGTKVCSWKLTKKSLYVFLTTLLVHPSGLVGNDFFQSSNEIVGLAGAAAAAGAALAPPLPLAASLSNRDFVPLKLFLRVVTTGFWWSWSW